MLPKLGPMIDFLFSLPLWLLGIILNVWLMGTALVGIWIARRYVLPRLNLTYDDAYYAAALVQSAMLLYGLIAALTAVGAWQGYGQVADVVSSEATAITSLWRDLGSYPRCAAGKRNGKSCHGRRRDRIGNRACALSLSPQNLPARLIKPAPVICQAFEAGCPISCHSLVASKFWLPFLHR
jgi:hypothetical protein